MELIERLKEKKKALEEMGQSFQLDAREANADGQGILALWLDELAEDVVDLAWNVDKIIKTERK